LGPSGAGHGGPREAHLIAAAVWILQADGSDVLSLIRVCHPVHGDVVALAERPQQPGRVRNPQLVPARGAVINLTLTCRKINKDPQVTARAARKRPRLVTREGQRCLKRWYRHRQAFLSSRFQRLRRQATGYPESRRG